MSSNILSFLGMVVAWEEHGTLKSLLINYVRLICIHYSLRLKCGHMGQYLAEELHKCLKTYGIADKRGAMTKRSTSMSDKGDNQDDGSDKDIDKLEFNVNQLASDEANLEKVKSNNKVKKKFEVSKSDHKFGWETLWKLHRLTQEDLKDACKRLDLLQVACWNSVAMKSKHIIEMQDALDVVANLSYHNTSCGMWLQ
ncbi:hypothetical protein OH76DRAFT_1423130 [Lentinus brumalis]|uniref:Uncharacterized protein n=1 Tax=Lentinus brumalis TaxID=2498619 RepID=A0A371CMD2_9APHY|nr:hypothetical protein OH76DRAFT_1423130 [Polyporus brumalis]